MPCSLRNNHILLWLLMFAMLIGCRSNSAMELSGGLMYSSGSMYVEFVNLDSKKSSVMYKSIGNGATIGRLTKIGDKRFIFEECLGTGSCFIKEFNVASGVGKVIRQGIYPTYIAENDSVFYYNLPEANKENWLLTSGEGGAGEPRKIAKAPISGDSRIDWWYFVTPVVKVSPDEVVLVGEDRQLWVYQISKSTLIPTGITKCLPQFLRNRTQQLVCYNPDTFDIYQIDLKTKQTEQLPQLKGANGLVYVPEYDIVIYGKVRLHFLVSEVSDIFAYSFSTGKTTEIQSRAYLASGFWIDSTTGQPTGAQ